VVENVLVAERYNLAQGHTLKEKVIKNPRGVLCDLMLVIQWGC
jgi:hypothetical protein